VKEFKAMIDGEISLKSLLFVTESLEQLIGQHGAKAVLRTAGQRAAANLIEMLPLTLPEDEAARRSGAILIELGFINEMQMPDPNTLQIIGNHIYKELKELGLHGTQSACYYVIGLFEGFFKQMSGSARKIISVGPAETGEYWKLG
jgi:predicted hydrocarbon binding protein